MKKILILIGLIAVLGACKVGKNYKGVELEVQESYRFQDTTAIVYIDTLNVDTLVADSLFDIDWFALFADDNLNGLVSSALAKNQDVLSAAEAVMQAQFQIGIQRSEMLPEISYSAGAARGNFQNGIFGTEANLFTGFGSVSWEIDFWGKFRRLNEAARADYVASLESYRAVKVSLVSLVAESYFELLENRMRLEISEQTLTLRDSMLGIIELRHEKGYIGEIDVNQAAIQRAIAAASIPVIERRIAIVENRLRVLTGQLPSQGIPETMRIQEMDTAVFIPEGLPSDLLTRRPDILIAEQNLIAQNALVGAAQANRLPSISLTGILGVASNDLSQLNSGNLAWNFGGSVLGPLFYFNRFKRIVDVEQSRRVQAVLSYEQTVLQAFREVEDILASIGFLKKELIARDEHVQAAVRAQSLSQERYSQGVTSYLEYLESQRQAFEAQQNYAGTKRELLSNYAKLYRALGGGWDI